MAIKNGEESLDELNLISEEEDRIIEQLDSIEKSADKYLDIIVKKNGEIGDAEVNNVIDDRIYKDAIFLNENVKKIDSEIKKIESEMFINSQKQNIGVNKLINSNPKLEEKVNYFIILLYIIGF